MNVSDLIEELREWPQDATVLVREGEGHYPPAFIYDEPCTVLKIVADTDEDYDGPVCADDAPY